MSEENIKLITSESVTEGHPDKICDQISDGILDAMLTSDPDSHAAIECFCTNGLVVVGGEARTKNYINVDETVRRILKGIGYNTPDSGFDCDSVGIMSALHEQSTEIAQGVDENKGEYLEQGAGDQGLMYGFATNETPEYMPLPIVLAHRLTARLAAARKSGELSYLRPDGKSQVTVEYHDNKAKRVETVVIAACHQAEIPLEKVRQDILEKIIQPIIGGLLDVETKIYINSTGAFTLGGPAADTGLTGRKIIVDTYGGFARHGGGCFSGKDASKVDRSGAYMARYVAKNIVAAGLADKCELQVAYAIGVARPVGLYLDTFGTGKITEEKILAAVKDNFDFRPKAIIDILGLKNPVFLKTAAYGHFGRPEFSWEQTDKAEALRAYLQK
jgi:S-adenosylmethionine synthetase